MEKVEKVGKTRKELGLKNETMKVFWTELSLLS